MKLQQMVKLVGETRTSC